MTHSIHSPAVHAEARLRGITLLQAYRNLETRRAIQRRVDAEQGRLMSKFIAGMADRFEQNNPDTAK